MRKRIVVLLLVLVFSFTSIGVSTVEASARTMDWSVVVWYQNVGDIAATVQVLIFPEGSSTGISYDPGYLIEPGGSASLYAGDVGSISSGFIGNAVLSSNQPLTATMMFYQSNPATKVRMFSNGFSSSDGSNQFLISTTLQNMWDRTTVFSIQNTETEDITVTLNFYYASDGSLASQKMYDIPAQSSKFIELDSIVDTGLPSTVFNGSLIIDAVKTASPGESANIVASANELYTNRDVGASFEGVPLTNASNKIYLSTGLCRAFGLDTYYAVQNTSYSNPVEFIVEYYNKDGVKVTTDGPYTIGPGQKRSIRTCDPSSGKSMAGFTGSAVITTTNPASRIVALGKAQTQVGSPGYTYNLFTIFNGEYRGYSRIGFPYVRWANDTRFNSSSNTGTFQRTYIAIQNLEPTDTKVNVIYYGKDGQVAATQVLIIPANSKANTNPKLASALGFDGMNLDEFGYYADGSYGGSAILEAHPDNPDAQLIAIVRVQHPGWGEDYNGIGIE